jgi:antitoxin component YwqK of YwqJK toxin-antitoxin module
MKRIIIFLIAILSVILADAQSLGYKVFESKGEYLNGLKEGRWIDQAKDGTIYREYFYKNGKPTGTWKYYSHLGEIRYESDIQDKIINSIRIFWPDLNYMEILLPVGFTDKQYNVLLEFEETFHQDQIRMQGLEFMGATITSEFRNKWRNDLEKSILSLLIDLTVTIYYNDHTIHTEIIFDKKSNVTVTKYYYDKRNNIKKKEFFENGKLMKYATYKDGTLIKEVNQIQ